MNDPVVMYKVVKKLENSFISPYVSPSVGETVVYTLGEYVKAPYGCRLFVYKEMLQLQELFNNNQMLLKCLVWDPKSITSLPDWDQYNPRYRRQLIKRFWKGFNGLSATRKWSKEITVLGDVYACMGLIPIGEVK